MFINFLWPKKCPKCYSRHIKLNGKNSQWKQKYRCKSCTYCFVEKYQKQPKIKSTKTYDLYIKEWYSYRQLSKQTKHIKRNLQWHIRKLIDNSHITDIDIIYKDIKFFRGRLGACCDRYLSSMFCSVRYHHLWYFLRYCNKFDG